MGSTFTFMFTAKALPRTGSGSRSRTTGKGASSSSLSPGPTRTAGAAPEPAAGAGPGGFDTDLGELRSSASSGTGTTASSQPRCVRVGTADASPERDGAEDHHDAPSLSPSPSRSGPASASGKAGAAVSHSGRTAGKAAASDGEPRGRSPPSGRNTAVRDTARSGRSQRSIGRGASTRSISPDDLANDGASILLQRSVSGTRTGSRGTSMGPSTGTRAASPDDGAIPTTGTGSLSASGSTRRTPSTASSDLPPSRLGSATDAVSSWQAGSRVLAAAATASDTPASESGGGLVSYLPADALAAPASGTHGKSAAYHGHGGAGSTAPASTVTAGATLALPFDGESANEDIVIAAADDAKAVASRVRQAVYRGRRVTIPSALTSESGLPDAHGDGPPGAGSHGGGGGSLTGAAMLIPASEATPAAIHGNAQDFSFIGTHGYSSGRRPGPSLPPIVARRQGSSHADDGGLALNGLYGTGQAMALPVIRGPSSSLVGTLAGSCPRPGPGSGLGTGPGSGSGSDCGEYPGIEETSLDHDAASPSRPATGADRRGSVAGPTQSRLPPISEVFTPSAAPSHPGQSDEGGDTLPLRVKAPAHDQPTVLAGRYASSPVSVSPTAASTIVIATHSAADAAATSTSASSASRNLSIAAAAAARTGSTPIAVAPRMRPGANATTAEKIAYLRSLRLRVLCVDDSDLNRAMITRLFVSVLGATCDGAENGAIAVSKVEAARADERLHLAAGRADEAARACIDIITMDKTVSLLLLALTIVPFRSTGLIVRQSHR